MFQQLFASIYDLGKSIYDLIIDWTVMGVNLVASDWVWSVNEVDNPQKW